MTERNPGGLRLDAVRPQIESRLAADLLRARLARARQKTRIDYAPGVAHFDPATPPEPGRTRRVIVTPAG